MTLGCLFVLVAVGAVVAAAAAVDVVGDDIVLGYTVVVLLFLLVLVPLMRSLLMSLQLCKVLRMVARRSRHCS